MHHHVDEFNKESAEFFDLRNWKHASDGNLTHSKLSPEGTVQRLVLKSSNISEVYCDKTSDLLFTRTVRGTLNISSYLEGHSTVMSTADYYRQTLRFI